jgi:hypothetical protein
VALELEVEEEPVLALENEVELDADEATFERNEPVPPDREVEELPQPVRQNAAARSVTISACLFIGIPLYF